jgi:hypothetical protein
MANITLIAPQNSFASLLTLTSSSSGLTSVLQVIQDGLGNNSPISLSTLSFKINTSMGNFYINDDPVLATALQINAVCRSASFLNFTTSLDLPLGTTVQRPIAPENGTIRYNSTTHRFEGYENGIWKNFTTT